MIPRTFSVKIIPRYRDLDTLGHVNNAVYLTYLEVARTQYFMKYFTIDDPRNFPFVIAQASINFRKPITIYDVAECLMAPIKIGNSSWTFGYVIRSTKGTIHADATTVQVHINPKTKTPVPLPSEMRNIFSQDLDEKFIEKMLKGDLHEN